MGRQSFPMYCWRTAPTAMSEASVMMLVEASGFGCERRVALARSSLIVAKAAVAFSLHSTVLVLPLEVESSLLSGWRVSVRFGRKRWLIQKLVKFMLGGGLKKITNDLHFLLEGVGTTWWPRNCSWATPNIHLDGLMMTPWVIQALQHPSQVVLVLLCTRTCDE